jgi:hypothetical protein
MRRAIGLLSAVSVLASCVGTNDRVAELQRQLQERDAEIAALRRQLGAAQQNESPSPTTTTAVIPQETPESSGDEEEMTRALERALVRLGALVLPEGTVEIEPEASYYYSEPNEGKRRDTLTSALTFRLGLPWAMQTDLHVPYVIYDRQSGVGSATGLGDIQIGLAKRLVAEREFIPELLLTGRWKPPTGSSDGPLQTGTGTHALQAQLTALKRQDPLVMIGGLSYTKNLQSGEIAPGDAVGGRLGIILAATPDTSVLLNVDVNSSFATKVDGQAVAETDRLRGVVEVGLVTVLSRDFLFNITTGIGFTTAAPDFQLTISLPIQF